MKESIVPAAGQFDEVIQIIQTSHDRALKAVNAEMIRMYWSVGKYLSELCATASFGDKVIDEVAAYIAQHNPGVKGFNRRGLYRMKQFYELYKDEEFVSPLVTQVSWTNHLLIMSGSKSAEERHFYLSLCVKEHYSKRELERQMDSAYYERSMLSCLVPIELKIGKFKPEHIGQINFYLEALDRTVKKPNENPSVGVVLCASKDDAVVEYALSRSMSPTLVSDYKLCLPDKEALQAKLREVTDIALEQADK